MVDRKGVLWFLGITFVITYVVELAMILFGGLRFTSGLNALFGQYVVAALMWAPALAAVVTIRFVTHEGFGIANIRFGSWRPYVGAALLFPAVFAAVYGLTWLLGLAQPDWELRWFRSLFVEYGTDATLPAPAPVMLAALFLVSVVTGPFLNMLFCFGEELGWRGYLLPKLMPLGKARAYVLVGIVWGLWHLPLVLVGFAYPGYPLLGSLAFLVLTTTLGIYINELTLHYRSSVLAGWIHAVFNSQKLGVWPLLFPGVNPLLGGYTGVIGLAALLALGLWQVRRGRSRSTAAA